MGLQQLPSGRGTWVGSGQDATHLSPTFNWPLGQPQLHEHGLSVFERTTWLLGQLQLHCGVQVPSGRKGRPLSHTHVLAKPPALPAGFVKFPFASLGHSHTNV